MPEQVPSCPHLDVHLLKQKGKKNVHPSFSGPLLHYSQESIIFTGTLLIARNPLMIHKEDGVEGGDHWVRELSSKTTGISNDNDICGGIPGYGIISAQCFGIIWQRRESMNLGASWRGISRQNNNFRSIHRLMTMSNQQIDKLAFQTLGFVDQEVVWLCH